MKRLFEWVEDMLYSLACTLEDGLYAAVELADTIVDWVAGTAAFLAPGFVAMKLWPGVIPNDGITFVVVSIGFWFVVYAIMHHRAVRVATDEYEKRVLDLTERGEPCEQHRAGGCLHCGATLRKQRGPREAGRQTLETLG